MEKVKPYEEDPIKTIVLIGHCAYAFHRIQNNVIKTFLILPRSGTLDEAESIETFKESRDRFINHWEYFDRISRQWEELQAQFPEIAELIETGYKTDFDKILSSSLKRKSDAQDEQLNKTIKLSSS